MDIALTKAMFEPHLHTKFMVGHESTGTVEMELVEATEKQGEKIYSVSLLFVGPEGQEIPENTYRIEHNEIPPLTLFMVPVGKSKEGVNYKVIVSRFKNQPQIP